MLKIDSGNRILRLDPVKVEKIVESYRKDRIADIYYKDSVSAEYTLSKEECERFIARCYPPERCHLRAENQCYWLKQTKNSSPRCIRCRLAQVYQLRVGHDLRGGAQQETRNPGLGYAAALLVMAGLTMFSIQNNAAAWTKVEVLKNENILLRKRLHHDKKELKSAHTMSLNGRNQGGTEQ